MRPPPVSAIDVVVVSHNTADLLVRCLDTVLAESPRSVVVVDHASSDGSAARVRREHPSVDVRAFDDNPGYAAGVNRGMAATDGDLCLVLNADTELRPGCLEALTVAAARHPSAAVLGPALLNPDGTRQRSTYPEPTPLRLALQDLGLLERLSRPRPTPAWLLGAALLLRREAWDRLGGFDEAYGMYFEEVDFCRRARAAGLEVRLVPDAHVVHVGGASTSAYRQSMARRYFASRARYYHQHYSRRRFHLLRAETAAVALGRLVQEAVRVRRGAGEADRAPMLRAVLADAASGWSAAVPWPE